jgi:hypothetical protein
MLLALFPRNQATRRRFWRCALLSLVLTGAGCGTTRWSDTARTATEQLLISNAVDQAVSDFDFSLLAGKEVYFDSSYLKGVTDENYIVSTLRQQLLADGCILREKKEDAEFVVEARSGGVGTDRSDLLFGVPAVSVPAVPGVPLPSAIPELPFAKSTNQKAVAKLAVFAYNRVTGRPVLQSGVSPAISTAKNSWFFGAGPFQRGSVYEGTNLAGGEIEIPIIGGRDDDVRRHASVPVTAPAIFPQNLTTPEELKVARENDSPDAAGAESTKENQRIVRLPESPASPAASSSSTPTASPPPPPPGVKQAQYVEPQSGMASGLPSGEAASGGGSPRQRLLDLGKLGDWLRGDKKPDNASQNP